MARTLLLLRHGQTTSNVTGRYMGRTDEDLSEEGYYQASCVAQRLRHWPIAEVYSSPLRRALNTARALMGPHALSIRTEDDLIEIDLGDWQGMYAPDIAAGYPDLWKAWRTDPSAFEPPGGESVIKVQQRVIAAMSRIGSPGDSRMVAFVTHDIVIRLLVARCLGAPLSIYRSLEIANASLTIMQSRGDKWRLRLLNDTAHLGDGAYSGAGRPVCEPFADQLGEV